MSFLNKRAASSRLMQLASRLRTRLVLQQPADSGDGAGGFVRDWNDVATLWGEVEPLTGNERADSGRIQSIVSHRITIRYRAGVNAAMRIACGDRLFNIRAVIDVYEMNRILELLCEEGSAV